MNPFWFRLLTGLAKELLPPIWEAITSGNQDRARHLAAVAARRYAEHNAAKEMLDELSKRRGDE